MPYLCGVWRFANAYYYWEFERRVDFMKRILKGMAEAAKKTAKASVNSASFLSMYQPKEPDVLKKKEEK